MLHGYYEHRTTWIDTFQSKEYHHIFLYFQFDFLPHWRQGRGVSLVKEGVPVGQKTVALLDGWADAGCHSLAEEPWLAALGALVRMAPEEWLQGPRLVPAHQQLWLGVLHKASYISWGRFDVNVIQQYSCFKMNLISSTWDGSFSVCVCTQQVSPKYLTFTKVHCCCGPKNGNLVQFTSTEGNACQT